MLGPVYLDTSAIIEFLRGNQRVRKIIEESSEIFTGVIQIYEIFFGEFYLEEKGYRSKIEEIKDFFLGLKTIKLEPEDSILASKIAAKLKAIGKTINDFDIIIAAQAIQRNLLLVTKDKDFERLKEFNLKAIFLE